MSVSVYPCSLAYTPECARSSDYPCRLCQCPVPIQPLQQPNCSTSRAHSLHIVPYSLHQVRRSTRWAVLMLQGDALWLTEDTHPEGGCRMLPRPAVSLTLGAETAAAADTPPPPPVLALGGGSLYTNVFSSLRMRDCLLCPLDVVSKLLALVPASAVTSGQAPLSSILFCSIELSLATMLITDNPWYLS